MLQSVIIADDLTGANDTGAILAHNGFKVGTVLNPEHMEDFDEYNVLSMSTDSRAMTAEQAYEKVSWAAGHFPKSDALVYSKRIDSTLRGNVGAEIDAILDFLGESYTAVVVASFPSSGRTCIGDVLLVNGEPLQLTEVSRDPINHRYCGRADGAPGGLHWPRAGRWQRSQAHGDAQGRLHRV